MAVVKIQEKETKKQQRNIYSISKKGPLVCTCTHTHTHVEEHFLIKNAIYKNEEMESGENSDCQNGEGCMVQ